MPVVDQFQTWRLELFVPLFEALRRGDLEEVRSFVEALPDPVPPSRRRIHLDRARRLERLQAPAALVDRERFLADRQAWLRAHLEEDGAAESALELAQGPRTLRLKELLAVRWLLDADYRAGIADGLPFARTYSAVDLAIFGTSALEIDGVRPFPRLWESSAGDSAPINDRGPVALFHWHEPPALEAAARLLERARDAKAPSFAAFRRTYAGASTYFSFCDVVTGAMLKTAYPRLVAAARRDALRLAAFYRWAARRGLCVDVSEVSL